MQLSEHFALEELTVTQHRYVNNTPPPAVIEHLYLTAAMLEKVRTLLGDKPIIVSSGYRSMQLNMLVGGTTNSAHIFGYAADFVCPAFGSPLDVVKAIAKSDLQFDQVIEEAGQWCHCSCDPKMRRQVLTAVRGPNGKMTYRQGLPPE